MKRLITIILFLLGARSLLAADPLTVSNNAYIVFSGDSLFGASDGVGFRIAAGYYAMRACMHPLSTNYIYVSYRSGGTMDDRLTNSFPPSLGFMGYRSNNNQHVVFSSSTSNGDLTSNQMLLAQSNMCLAPVVMSDGTYPLVTQTGWAATHPYQVIPFGNPPDGAPTDEATEGSRSGAALFAGNSFGVVGINSWLEMVYNVTNDINANGGTNVGFSPDGHIIGGLDLNWQYLLARKTTPSDTNVANSMVDFATGTVVSTNNCVVFSVSKTGNSITFSRFDLGLPPPFFYPYPDGSMTNNTWTGFNLNPTNITQYNFGVGITNLPLGTWNVIVDGQFTGTCTSQTLSSGWNMLTNNVGPYYNQSQQVLIRVLDWFYVDHKTLIPGSAGAQIGMVTVGSQSASFWSSNDRGDNIIAAMTPVMDQVQTNFASIYQAAQPTNHTLSFVLQSVGSPAPFRP